MSLIATTLDSCAALIASSTVNDSIPILVRVGEMSPAAAIRGFAFRLRAAGCLGVVREGSLVVKRISSRDIKD